MEAIYPLDIQEPPNSNRLEAILSSVAVFNAETGTKALKTPSCPYLEAVENLNSGDLIRTTRTI